MQQVAGTKVCTGTATLSKIAAILIAVRAEWILTSSFAAKSVVDGRLAGAFAVVIEKTLLDLRVEWIWAVKCERAEGIDNVWVEDYRIWNAITTPPAGLLCIPFRNCSHAGCEERDDRGPLHLGKGSDGIIMLWNGRRMDERCAMNGSEVQASGQTYYDEQKAED